MSHNAITFVALVEEHRSLLLRWLSSPHAQIWWGDPQEELALIYDDKGEHQAFLACMNDEPIAYIQAWWPSKHPDLPWQHAMTPTTRGIDITIGEEKYLGKGLGTQFVKHFAAKLFAEGATRLIIDPAINNDRAVACYMKAGFTPYETFAAPEGTDLLMEMFPEDLDYGHGHAQT